MPKTKLQQKQSWADITEEDEYQLVRVKKPEADRKAVSTVSDVKLTRAVVFSKNALTRGGVRGVGLKPVKTTLSFKTSAASGANAALTAVIPIEPASSSNFASFAAIYDEIKVDSVDFHFVVAVTAPVNSINMGVLVYDPVDATVLSSVAQGADYKQSTLFVLPSSVAGTTAFPLAETKNGFMQFHVKQPRGTQLSSTVTTNFTGSWTNCQDSADTYGWIKPYIEATGAASVSDLFGIVKMHVTFRSRR